MRFWVGGWGSDLGGESSGIALLQAGDDQSPLVGGQLALGEAPVSAPSPSWLARHPRADVVYAALESRGQIAAFSVGEHGALRPAGGVVDAGEAVCHLAVAPDGSFLVASCWGDGKVVVVPLAPDGRLGSPEVAAAATDPYAALGERETRAHCAAFLVGNRGAMRVVTTDLGFDLVRFWRVSDRRLVLDHDVRLPYGVGPRHVLPHPSGHLYVVTEYSCEVYVLRQGADGRWMLRDGLSVAAGLGGADTGAEIAMTSDGESVSVGIRGSGTLAVLRVRGDGDALQPVALVDAGVVTPRFHLVGRDALLVAGQDSHEIASLPLDARSGIPGRVTRRVGVASPTHLLAVPR